MVNFKGLSQDFSHFISALEGKVIRIYPENSHYASYKVIIGATKIPRDYIIHLVDVEGEIVNKDDVEFLIKDGEIEFRLLSQIMKGGIDIFPEDQLED